MSLCTRPSPPLVPAAPQVQHLHKPFIILRQDWLLLPMALLAAPRSPGPRLQLLGPWAARVRPAGWPAALHGSLSFCASPSAASQTPHRSHPRARPSLADATALSALLAFPGHNASERCLGHHGPACSSSCSSVGHVCTVPLRGATSPRARSPPIRLRQSPPCDPFPDHQAAS